MSARRPGGGAMSARPTGGGVGVPPRPRVEIELEGAVPAAVLRLLPAVLVVVCAVVVDGGSVVRVLALAAAGLLVWRPEWPVAPMMALLTGLWVLGRDDFADGPDGPWRLAALVLVVHLLLRSAALAGHLAWRSRIERAVLGAVARSVVGVQLLAQGLLLATGWLRPSAGAGAGTGGGQEGLRVVAVVAVVVVTALVVPRAWSRR